MPIPEGVRNRMKGHRGQALVLVALALPLLFAIVALVIDGSSLLAQRRSVQNAADAASLAAAQELPGSGVCAGSPLDPLTCQGKVKARADQYSQINGGPPLTGGASGR